MWWTNVDKWCSGIVSEYDNTYKKHHIVYDDGDKKYHNLNEDSKEMWKFISFPPNMQL